MSRQDYLSFAFLVVLITLIVNLLLVVDLGEGYDGWGSGHSGYGVGGHK